ncbi:MAG: hypothetical protein LBJ70_04330 [Holosporales bacterium]|nr:hypothetical protein [Holosporales bacterium]
MTIRNLLFAVSLLSISFAAFPMRDRREIADPIRPSKISEEAILVSYHTGLFFTDLKSLTPINRANLFLMDRTNLSLGDLLHLFLNRMDPIPGDSMGPVLVVDPTDPALIHRTRPIPIDSMGLVWVVDRTDPTLIHRTDLVPVDSMGLVLVVDRTDPALTDRTDLVPIDGTNLVPVDSTGFVLMDCTSLALMNLQEMANLLGYLQDDQGIFQRAEQEFRRRAAMPLIDRLLYALTVPNSRFDRTVRLMGQLSEAEWARFKVHTRHSTISNAFKKFYHLFLPAIAYPPPGSEHAALRACIMQKPILDPQDLPILGNQVVVTVLGSLPIGRRDILHSVLGVYQDILFSFGIPLSRVLHGSCGYDPDHIPGGVESIQDCLCAVIDPGEEELRSLPGDQLLIMSSGLIASEFVRNSSRFARLANKLAVDGCLILTNTPFRLQNGFMDLLSGRFLVKTFANYKKFFTFAMQSDDHGVRLASLVLPLLRVVRHVSMVEERGGNLAEVIQSTLKNPSPPIHYVKRLQPKASPGSGGSA